MDYIVKLMALGKGLNMTKKVGQLMALAKLGELLNSKEEVVEEEKKESNVLLWVLAIVGCVAVIAGIAYAVYRFMTPDYFGDYDDDFDDDFENEDAEEEEAAKAEEKKEAVAEKKEEAPKKRAAAKKKADKE